MSTKVNEQQTLFRFRSLRAPELSNPVDQEFRFVNDISLTSSIFYLAVKDDRQPGESKWDAMKRAANNFSPFDSPEAIEKKYPKNVEISNWIARNRSSFNPDELRDKLAQASKDDDRALWDNLYYQILMHDNFYIKDVVIQLLNLQNILVQVERLKDPVLIDKALPELANARIVMPVYLFVEDDTESDATPQRPSGEEPLFRTKGLYNVLEVSMAKSEVLSYDTAVTELLVLQKKYYKDYDAAYKKADDAFQIAVEAAYNAATVVEKKKIDCPSGCEEIYYEYTNLNLPTFSFTAPIEIDKAKLKIALTEGSYYVVESLKLLSETTYDAIISGINEASQKKYQQIYDILPNQETVVAVGGMLFANRSGGGETTNDFVTNLEVPFSADIQETSLSPKRVKIHMTLDLGFPNADVFKVFYTATFPTENNSSGAFTESTYGNKLSLVLFPNGNGVLIPSGVTTIPLELEITLVDGTIIQCNFTLPFNTKYQGVGHITRQTSTNNGDNQTAFVPKDFGIRRLGIADYRKVVSEVCCYHEAEVSHIENIMAGEFRSKTTTRERIEENTTTTERQTEVENLTDASTNSRFEMQTEIARQLVQQKEFGAYATVSGSYSGITFETGANYATNSAKEESNRQAVTESKEITQRAMERIVTKFREEQITKITESFKDENSHIYDNRTGANNISGVYRYINAVYKNQIYNYGKRLMYEFMIPEPSRLFRFGMEVAAGTTPTPSTGTPQLAPPTPTSLGLLSPRSLDENGYLSLAAVYHAEVEAPLPFNAVIGKSYQASGMAAGGISKEFNDLKIPDDYALSSYDFVFSGRKVGAGNVNGQIQIGNKSFEIVRSGAFVSGYMTRFSGTSGLITDGTNYNQDTIPVSIAGWDIGSFALNVTAKLSRKKASFENWQMKTYEIIIKAYNARLKEYNESITVAVDDSVKVLGTNPLFHRQIEQITLKKNCLSYLLPETEMGQQYYTGNSFTTYKVTRDQDMDNYASTAKFMEQAFEWDIMSYNFYPYYWGGRSNWIQLNQSEEDDAVFRSFMQSGMARVIVSVKPGFEDAVMYFMATKQIWNGGEMPVIGDPLYKSIVDELAHQEYVVEETWETVLPTSLIGLQNNGVLIAVDGLPCGGGCEVGDTNNPLKPNTNKLKPPIEKPV